MFKKGVVSPSQKGARGKVEDFQFSSSKLQQTLTNAGVDTVGKLMPQFKSADTLAITRTGESVKLTDWSHVYLLQLKNAQQRKELIDLLNNSVSVIYAEPNHTGTLFLIPDDTHFDKQWHLKNDGTNDQGSGTADADIDAELAWDITTGSNSIKIGIVDGGMQTNHVDFAGRVSGDSGDNFFHGTMVAGVAAAQGNNGIGVAGVAWNTLIINEDIGGLDPIIADAAAAVLSAANRGSHIINNSWGFYGYSITLRNAFADVYNLNRVAVAAMGNDADGPYSELRYPAGFEYGIISVGATDNKDVRASFSNRGSWIDVVAPGVNIYTTDINNTYNYASGTSFAAPQVSGIAGLLLSYNPSLYNDDIEQIIRLSTDQVDGMNGQAFHEDYGTGRVNARKALDLLRSPNHFVHKSATGGSVYSSTGTYTMVFHASSGLAPGVYIVKRYEVRKSVSFGQTYQSPHVWGRGVGTTGTTAENPNFGMGWCDIISSGNNSATLRTFVYEVWDEAGNRIGYYPTSPSNVNFNYTILGKRAPLTATISGPTLLNTGQQGTFTANATGGTGSYTNYRWWERNDDGALLPKVSTTGDVSPEALPPGYWFEVSSWEGQQTVNKTSSGYNFSLKVRVYDSSGDYDEDIHSVAVGGGLTKLAHQETIDIPDAFNLGPNFPNPFTANTTIKYDLPTESRVTLDIYDVAGRKVRTLVTGTQPARYHTITWDGQSDAGQDVQPGVYLYRMQAEALDASDSFTRIEKLVKTWE